MKHQYFGDVNDYVKYGLLRCFATAGLRVGVCWMLTSDDERPDGRKVQYLLRPAEWKDHDPELFGHLAQTLNARDGRHLRHIEGNWAEGLVKIRLLERVARKLEAREVTARVSTLPPRETN